MLGVLGDRHRAGRSCEEIQVVDVVPRSSDNGVVAAADEDCIPVSGFHGSLGCMLARIKMLKSEGLGLVHAVVIDLVEIDFPWRVVHVMLMGRVTRPVSARGVYLDHDEFVSREGRWDDIDDLT